MQDGKILVWLDTRQGTSGEMELVVRLPGKDTEQWGTQEVLALQVWVRGSGKTGQYLLEEKGTIQAGEGMEAVFPCPGVRLWDPEHPWLYEVCVEIWQEASRLVRWEQKLGFRTLKRKGKQVFWNGCPVKLKGICYREHVEDPQGTRKDLELFARANVNFLRGIYGPFSQTLLELCDEMGFWVEDTAPFYEVGDGKPATQDLPHLKEEYLDAFRGMTALGSHTSVLVWSLGHDCAWGANFRHGADYLRQVDPVRLLTFHLPMSIPEEEVQMDIWPVHYIDWKQPFDVCYDQMVIFHTPGAENEIGYMTGQAAYQMPVLHQVWSPVACHNRDEIQADPSIRRFWGESIHRFVEKSWQTDGCLGGAVLAGVDEDGSFEGMGHYQWGILDHTHTPKPEYASLRQAYAPVVVKDAHREEGKLILEVENRLSFTDLSQCRLVVDGRELPVVLLKGAPGSQVEVCVDPGVGESFETRVSFVSGDGRREYGSYCYRQEQGRTDQKTSRASVTEGRGKQVLPDSFAILEEEGKLLVKNSCFTYVFDRTECLLKEVYAAGVRILAGGPYLNCTGLRLGPWQGKKLDAIPVGDSVQVTIEGTYEGVLAIRFILLVGQDGLLDTCYEVQELYRHMPHTVKAQIGVSPGGLNEKGVAYLLPGEVDVTVEGENGHLYLVESGQGSVGGCNGWRQDEDARTTGKGHVQVCAPFGNVRVEEAPWLTEEAMVDDRDDRMQFTGQWYRMDDACGNYQGTETLSRRAGDTMRLLFTGTGVKLYGPLDMNYGMCEIFLDGKLVEQEVDQYPDKVDLAGASRGYEKRYGQLLAAICNLPEREHVLEVKVSGRKAKGAQNTYTSIDYAILEGSRYHTGKWLCINREYNYIRLVRGCYQNPKVELVPGIREQVRMKLAGQGFAGTNGPGVQSGREACMRKEGSLV